MRTRKETQLWALVGDWHQRAEGLQKKAHELKRKGFRSKIDMELTRADYFGKAAAYRFAALDLSAKLSHEG